MTNILPGALRKKIKSYVPETWVDQLRLTLGQRKRVFDFHSVDQKHRELFPKAKLVEASRFVTEIFQVFYGKKNANEIIPAHSIHYVHSWVPFYAGQTKLFLYNFFEKNYGVRDPVYVRFILLDQEQNVQAVSVKILAANALFFSGNLFAQEQSSYQDGSLIVQVVHPKIRQPIQLQKQFRYFVFYTDSESPNCAVHSFPVPKRGLIGKSPIGYRNIGPKERTFLATFTQTKNPLETNSEKNNLDLLPLSSKHAMDGAGYFVHFDRNNILRSIWHDGPNPHSVKTAARSEKLGNSQTAFFVPNFKKHAPIFVVSASQVGFLPEKMQINLFDEYGECLATENCDVVEDHEAFDCQEIFKAQSVDGPCSVVIDFCRDNGEFESAPEAYVHVYYQDSQGQILDQVHSHSSFGYTNAFSQKAKSFRCLKFAPFIKSDKLEFFYSVVNVGGKSANADEHVFIRIITDQGFEHRLKLDAPKDRVSFLSSKEILQKYNSEITELAIVQLEHQSTNFNGSWYCFDQENDRLATDHFTGG